MYQANFEKKGEIKTLSYMKNWKVTIAGMLYKVKGNVTGGNVQFIKC